MSKVRRDDFACDHGRWQKRRCELIMEWALDYLKADRENLLTHTVYALDGWKAAITGMPVDQWGAIQTETYDGEWKTFIQCDDFEHGLAFTVKAYHDEFGETR